MIMSKVIEFVECNKAVDPRRLIPNIWGLLGLPRIYGYFLGSAEENEQKESCVYLDSYQDLEYFKEIKIKLRQNYQEQELTWQSWPSYKLGLQEIDNGWYKTYKIESVSIHHRICPAK